jgi:hypothetical protein
LIDVAHHAQASTSPEGLSTGGNAGHIRRPNHDQTNKLVLNPISILKFIDHHVAKSLVIVVANLSHPAEQFHGLDQEIVEVQGVGLPQSGFVELEDLPYLFNTIGRKVGLAGISRGTRPSILCAAYRGQCLTGRQGLVVHQVQLLHNLADEPFLIVLVVDREVASVSGFQSFNASTKHTNTQGVKRGNQRR